MKFHTPRLAVRSLLVLSTACLTPTALAQDISIEEQRKASEESRAAEPASASETVEVTGTRAADLGLDLPSTAGSRLGLTSLETPASVVVLPGRLFRDLGVSSVVAAKTLAPGVTSATQPGNGHSQLSARGFTGQVSVKQLYNGLDLFNAGGVSSFPSDPWNIERIEVLYGPASVLYGTGAIGGAVNVLPKRPTPSQPGLEAEISGGSYGMRHAAFGATDALTDTLSYRVDASYGAADGWVDRGESESFSASASLRWEIAPDWSLTLSNDYGLQDPMMYLGTPTLNDQPVEALIGKNYNNKDQRLRFIDNIAAAELVWEIADGISFHNTSYYIFHRRIYHDVTTFTYQPATNTVRRTGFRDVDSEQWQYGNTGYVKLEDSVFGGRNSLLVGFDVTENFYDRYDNALASGGYGGSSVVPAEAYVPRDWTADFATERSNKYFIRVGQYGFFAEDRLELSDDLSLVAGLRYDSYKVRRDDRFSTFQRTVSDYDAVGWNAGFVYEPIEDLSLYAQYAEASDPVTGLASIGASQQDFSLSDGYQYEIGVKQALWDGQIQWTLAAYKLVKKDLLTSSVANPSIQEQVGQQSSRGIEASVSLNLGEVSIDLNGTVLEAEFDDFRASVGGVATSLAGNVPLNVPEQTASARVFWTFLPDWEVRAAWRYVGKRYSDNTNLRELPSYSVVDLGLSWDVTEDTRLDLAVENVLDETYASWGSNTQWILGNPRTVTARVNVTF